MRADLACPKCEGRGEILHFRCPSSMADEDGRAAVRGFAHASYGSQPDAGGWAEQNAMGAALIDVVAFEVALIRASNED